MTTPAAQRTAIVTGASAGVGKAAAIALVAQGWRVIGVGRDAARCAATEAELDTPAFTMLRADLSLMAEVARVARGIAALTDRVDALLNNAGGVYAHRIMTREGHESTFAANHLAPFLLTRTLMPLLRAASAPRVIAVSSTGHAQCDGIRWDDLTFANGFVGGAAYCNAKLANILFARELARREGGTIVSHAMHPGVVDSNFAAHCDAPMQAYMASIRDRSVTPAAAADTLVWLASAEEPGRTNGGYFYERQPIEPSAAARDDAAARRLWAISDALVAGY